VRSRSIEDYIKAIYAIEAEHRRASTKRIADRLGVKMASVTGMIKHLAAEGYVQHKPYHGVVLTARGREVAVSMIRRHRVIEMFLSQTLGLSWDEVDADAEVLEHAVSDKLIERIYDFLNRPDFDPHGSPIPRGDGSFPQLRAVPLSQLKEGQVGSIVQVCDRDPAFLRYLTKLNIKIGSKIRVVSRSPIDNVMQLKIGRSTAALGPDAASRIRVEPERRPGKSRKKTKPD
jgi:DtxR family Mn-dependent transcriptional regulator